LLATWRDSSHWCTAPSPMMPLWAAPERAAKLNTVSNGSYWQLVQACSTDHAVTGATSAVHSPLPPWCQVRLHVQLPRASPRGRHSSLRRGCSVDVLPNGRSRSSKVAHKSWGQTPTAKAPTMTPTRARAARCITTDTVRRIHI